MFDGPILEKLCGLPVEEIWGLVGCVDCPRKGCAKCQREGCADWAIEGCVGCPRKCCVDCSIKDCVVCGKEVKLRRLLRVKKLIYLISCKLIF